MVNGVTLTRLSLILLSVTWLMVSGSNATPYDYPGGGFVAAIQTDTAPNQQKIANVIHQMWHDHHVGREVAIPTAAPSDQGPSDRGGCLPTSCPLQSW